jgi:predicted permease
MWLTAPLVAVVWAGQVMTIPNDLTIALRHHRRQPAFALTVICTLAFTVGATSAVFSIVNTVLVRELPFAAPDRLVYVASVRSDNPAAPFTLPEFMDYRSRTRTLAGLAAYANWSASLAGDGITERFTGLRMSANVFDVLGARPAAGRVLNDGDDRPDAPRVVMLSYRLWQQRYGGAADVVGRSVRINSEPFTIVGILPAQFPLPLRDIDVVTPLVPEGDPLRHLRNSVNFLRFIGRLTPGVDTLQAQAELTAICGSLRQQFPVEYARKGGVSVTKLHDAIVGGFRQPMFLLLGAVMVVLAAALANLASLSLVRAHGRTSELSMRIALGASRWHLVRQLTVEALMLAAIGAALGWALAVQAIAAAALWAPPSVPRLGEASVDRTVLAFVTALTVVVTALLAAASLGARWAAQGNTLKPASHGAVSDRWSHRVRNIMVIAEISAALVLLLATIVLTKNLFDLQDLDTGFDPDGVFQARVSIPPTYRSPDDLARFYDRLTEQLAATPGARKIGVISVAPLSGLLATVPFTAGDQSPADPDRPSANLRVISPGYLQAVGTRMRHGRSFTETDRSNSPRVALVSAALADRFFSSGAIGRRLLINDNNEGPRPVEIVGVVENVSHTALDQPPGLDIYIPLRQIHPDNVSMLRNNQFWVISTRGPRGADPAGSTAQAGTDPEALRAPFLAHLRAIDPDAAVSSTGTMRQYLDLWLRPRRFNLGLFGAFALTAVLLAISGLYGLVSYAVSQRTREIGLRMAIGASQRDVQRMILGQAARLGIGGAVMGLGLALIVRSVTTSMIEGVWIDLRLVAATAALLIAVVLMAAWLPARRASRIDPTRVLRG